MKKKTVCLNMIVKNESVAIKRCLASIKNLIDYWVIVDTGSTDGTQDIIREFLKDIPGEIHERPWEDFSYNRNEALAFAKGKGDYLLIIDADEELQYSDSFGLPELEYDYYMVLYRHSGGNSQRILLIDNHQDWKWNGVIHESLNNEEKKTAALLQNVINMALAKDGARSRDPDKYFKDAKAIEKALETDPENPRLIFHLATTYIITNQHSLALKMFEKRAKMGGFRLEVYYSYYQVALLQEARGESHEIFLPNLLKAYHNDSSRVEPLFAIANYFVSKNQFLLGYLISKLALPIPIPVVYYYTNEWMYKWGVLYQYATCAFQIGKKSEATEAVNKLLSVGDLPTDIRKKIDLLQSLLERSNLVA